MWVILAIASVGIGAAFLRLFQFSLTKVGFWVASSVIGLVISAYTGLAISYAMDFTVTSQIVTSAILILLAALGYWLLPKPTYIQDKSSVNTAWGWLIVVGVILFLVGIMTLTTKDDGLFINNRHNYGDIRLHLSYINNFLYGQNIPVENPIFSGTPPSYPFLVNFLTAQFTLLGLPVTFAINGLTVIGCGFIATMLWQVSQLLFKNKAVTTWTIVIFFLGGGWGFIHLLPEWSTVGWTRDYWGYLTHDFSMYQEKGYWFSNVVISFLTTQRSLLLGMPFTLFILYQLFQVTQNTPTRSYIGLGLLAGLLPLVHISSLIIVALFGVYIGIISLVRAHKDGDLVPQIGQWVAFALPTSLIGLFLIDTFIGQTSSITDFVRINSSWMGDKHGFFVFWWKNAGVLLVLNGLAYAWLRQQKEIRTSLLAFSYVIFLIFNFVIMQPWEFDNAKYLIYWFLFACMLAGYAVVKIWSKQRLIAGVLIFLLLISGTVDLVRRIVVPEMKIQVATAADLTMVTEMRAVIPPKSAVLTYGSVLSPVVDYLGRRMVYGDTPWLWSHSIDHEPRLAQISDIYSGKNNARDLLSQLKVDFIVVSDNERSKYTSLNEGYFKDNFPVVYTSTNQHLTLYKVAR